MRVNLKLLFVGRSMLSPQEVQAIQRSDSIPINVLTFVVNDGNDDPSSSRSAPVRALKPSFYISVEPNVLVALTHRVPIRQTKRDSSPKELLILA